MLSKSFSFIKRLRSQRFVMLLISALLWVSSGGFGHHPSPPAPINVCFELEGSSVGCQCYASVPTWNGVVKSVYNDGNGHTTNYTDSLFSIAAGNNVIICHLTSDWPQPGASIVVLSNCETNPKVTCKSKATPFPPGSNNGQPVFIAVILYCTGC